MSEQKPFHAPRPVEEDGEPDYSDPTGDDFDALSRDRVPVRSLRSDDLDAIVRIDAKVVGHERRDYLQAKVDEALNESGIRVSLIAEYDGRPAGFIMARVDFGEFGRTESVAVLDTIGIDPTLGGGGIGKALLSQLLANLSALHVETLETQVARENFDLLGFFYHCGFRPSQRLAFDKRVT